MDHDGDDACQFLVAAAEILGAVEVAEEEFRSRVVARACQQVGIASGETCRLPLLEPREIVGVGIAHPRDTQRLRLGDAGGQFVTDGFLVEILIHGANYPSRRHGVVRVACLISKDDGA